MPQVTVATPFGNMTGEGNTNADGTVNVDISDEVERLVREHDDTQASLAAIRSQLSTIQGVLLQLLAKSL